MRLVSFAATGILATAFFASGANAQDACAAIKGEKAGSLYLVSTPPLEPAKIQKIAMTKSTIPSGAAPLQFAYILPDTKPDRSGVIVAKITKKSEGVRTAERSKPATVRLRRDLYQRVCGTRDYRDLWPFGSHIRPSIDTEVPVADYIYYHKTTSDNRQVALYEYHVNYQDPEGACVGTDDSRNGNRQQFLYGNDKTRDNSLIASTVQTAFISAAEAVGAGVIAGAAKKIKVPDGLKKLVENYIQFDEMQTHLIPYQTSKSSCITVNVSSVESGQVLAITLNDLESREGRSRSRRPEHVWTIPIQ